MRWRAKLLRRRLVMGRDKNDRRSKETRHVRLYSYITSSPAWHDLTGNAVKALVYLATWENGSNNGELYMSERLLAEGIGVCKRTAHAIFDELEDHGFIVPTAKGYFSVKRGPATSWRLTWVGCSLTAGRPTNDFRAWRPGNEENTRAQKIAATGVKTAPAVSARRSRSAKVAPVEPSSMRPMGAKNDPHSIAIGSGLGWWDTDRSLSRAKLFLSVLSAPVRPYPRLSDYEVAEG